ncbi:hypothetical protein DSM104443_00575 [Usitatibacter rugosus]|uniref:Uncharacterized protein n=1 Tax=Usitatibacter rugosus TaxID=2732067 RepID=A0A6M4GR23_9PROT|nr:hypothetical protein [Usitatibacter rugosus]QJR09526.1 hypothetical protein DSM104443_00575 [Usitatibacter rugosus]
MALLPELAESAASGEKARIYAEMRRLGAVPMVALIFRHLATLPGGLEWTWGAIGPAWKSGRLQETAWKIAGETPLDPIAAFPREALTALGVDDAAIEEIRIVARAYNLANPVNLLTVTCLSRVLGGAKASVALDACAWSPPVAPGPLVAMTAPADLSPEVSALLELVAAPGSANGPRVVQSLYRHFGHRPQFLALLVTCLLPRFRDGSIDRGVATIRAAMSRAADAIVPTMDAPPAPDPGIGAAFERFGFVIPQMIVVGRLLEEAIRN